MDADATATTAPKQAEELRVLDPRRLLAARRGSRVLKHGDTFAVFDRYGDIAAGGAGEQGLYHAGTRFLSRLELRLEGGRPLLL